MTAKPLRLQLILEHDADPIRGRLVLENGESVVFAGWLELIAAVEASRDNVGTSPTDALNEIPFGPTVS